MPSLNDRMEFGHVIRVHADGTVTDAIDVYGPESLSVELDADGQMIGSDARDGIDVLVDWQYWRERGWHLMHGYTGQYDASSRSFIMHESEYVGGRMARDILAQPGYYVTVTVDGLPTDDSYDGDTLVGWAVAYRSAE